MGFLILGNKTFDFSCKKKDFLPKNDQIWPEIGILGHFGPGLASSFGALLVGWLVVEARKTPVYFYFLLFTIKSHSGERKKLSFFIDALHKTS